MVRRITTFKSKNLLGETRKEERRRISKVISKAISSGRSPIQIRRISTLSGASSSQLKKRKNILKDSGLSKQKAKTVKQARFI